MEWCTTTTIEGIDIGALEQQLKDGVEVVGVDRRVQRRLAAETDSATTARNASRLRASTQRHRLRFVLCR